jgi:aspartate 1-decarboxylase
MPLIEILKSKLHRVKVTEANLNYVGSITIDEDLMNAGNIIENEKVLIVNNNNGERFETYVITGERGSGIIIVISFFHMEFEEAKTFKPWLVFVDENNKLK